MFILTGHGYYIPRMAVRPSIKIIICKRLDLSSQRK